MDALTRPLVRAITGSDDIWYEPLCTALPGFGITNDRRVKMFLAQCAHESAGFERLVENLRYSASALLRTWPARFSVADATAMAYNELRIAERAYGGRMGNAPEGAGDGYRYRGRGLIQVTGKANYRACGDALGLDLLATPELLEEPEHAAISAAWYWSSRGCNELADADDYAGITRAINGGMHGHPDRVAWLERAERAA